MFLGLDKCDDFCIIIGVQKMTHKRELWLYTNEKRGVSVWMRLEFYIDESWLHDVKNRVRLLFKIGYSIIRQTVHSYEKYTGGIF